MATRNYTVAQKRYKISDTTYKCSSSSHTHTHHSDELKHTATIKHTTVCIYGGNTAKLEKQQQIV